MKKKIFYSLALFCAVAVLTACGHSPVEPVKTPDKPTPDNPTEKPENPPTPNDILATYSGDKLVLTVEGAEAGNAPKVVISKGNSESLVDMDLYNIIPAIAEYTIDDVKFSSATKSIYYCKLSGAVDDNLAGWKIAVEGKVDEGILTLNVKLEKIEGQPITNASDLFSTYKGDMQISLSGNPAGDETEQRVYVSEATENKESSVKLSIRNFSFSEMNIGNIEFDNVPVTKRGEVYGFEVADRELTVKIAGQDFTLTAKVFGIIDDGSMYLNVDLVGSGLEINVLFDGESVKESTVAEITGYTFENGGAIADQITTGKSTNLYFWDDTDASDLLITLKPELAEGASIAKLEGYYNGATNVLEVGEPINFSLFTGESDYIRYTVQAEDPSITATYIIYTKWLKSIPLANDFTSLKWISNEQESFMLYYEPEGWATSNSATSLLKIFSGADGLPLCPYELNPVSQNDERAAKVITIDTKGMDMGFAFVPAVTAGTLFLGSFEIDMTNTLKSTKFGVPFNARPVKMTGEYKYNAGPVYYKTIVMSKDGEEVRDVYKEEVPGRADEFAINAILYEVENYSETLDGTNINDSKKVVATALLSDGSVADWTTFEISFDYIKQYDPSKKYKLAVICSSSKEGNSFEGAPESELFVKSLNIEATR